MAIVIGLDLGNFNSYPSYIADLTARRSRLGGRAVDLVPASEQQGVPSVFFYKEGKPVLAGRAATTGAAKPERNRIRYLKRSLGLPLEIDGKSVVIDGRTWTYDDAIREVAQSVLREAVRELQQLTSERTNLVSLAYPATYSCAQRERLIQIVQSATTEDGTPFQVVGTIMEPAAAALDYLAQAKRTKNTTVLVFDLGGGTFDLSLVTCYPRGKKRADESTAYYDIHVSDGLADVGGREFDDVIAGMLRVRLAEALNRDGLTMTNYLEEQIRLNAERVKKELSDPPYHTVYEAYVPALDDTVSLEISREEFEKEPRVVTMLSQMTEKARELLGTKSLPKPELIVLTGGSCRMPMIREALVKALPDYAGSIDAIREYKPEKAISYGAARYGIPEPNNDAVIEGSTSVIKRLAYDIGINYLRGEGVSYINTFLTQGTELPCTTPWTGGWLPEDSTFLSYSLYEANRADPVPEQIERDYRFIKTVRIQFESVMPKETRTEARLIVDKDGLVTMEARKDENSPLFTVTAKLENLI